MFFATEMCGKDAYQLTPKKKTELDLESLKNRLKEFEVKYCDALVLILKYEDKAVTVFSNGRMMVKNVKAENEAVKIARKIIE